MVYYLNESNNIGSISDLCNEYALSINEALHEYNMSILSDKYNFICENGYEMPINEAEEKKQGFFKQLIQRIKAALKKLCDKAITKLKSFMSNHPDSKLNPFISKINNIFTKASNKLDKSKSADEAKSISNDASEEVKNTTNEGLKNNIKESNKKITFENDDPIGPGKVSAERLYGRDQVSSTEDAIKVRDACKKYHNYFDTLNLDFEKLNIPIGISKILGNKMNSIFDETKPELSSKKDCIRLAVELLFLYDADVNTIIYKLNKHSNKNDNIDAFIKDINNQHRDVSIKFKSENNL